MLEKLNTNSRKCYKLSHLNTAGFTAIKNCLFFIFILFAISSKGQESMIPDVSEVYLQKLVDTAKVYYPKMRMHKSRVELAENNVKKSKLSWFEILTFSFLYSPNNSTTLINPSFLNGYQVGLYVNMGLLLQKPYLIKQAKKEYEVVKAEQDEYNLNIEALVKQRYYLYVQAVTMLKVKMQAVLDIEGTMQQFKYKFEKGEGSFEDYNKFMITYDDRLQAKVEAEGFLLIAKSNLEELLGKKLEQIK